MGEKEEATPGPWVVRECIGQVYFQIVPEQIPSDSGLYQIGDVCASRHGLDGGEHIYGGEQEANARMMAASRDMYEALKEILADYADAALEWDTENKWKALEISRKAEFALAKARGDGND